MPNLLERLSGFSLRVPTASGSLSEVVCQTKETVPVQDIHNAFKASADGKLKGILKYETAQLVSSDYIGSSYSCIFDSNYTNVVNGNLVQVFGWYDNEWDILHALSILSKKSAGIFSLETLLSIYYNSFALVICAVWNHLFPFRTEKLNMNSAYDTVFICGTIGHRQGDSMLRFCLSSYIPLLRWFTTRRVDKAA